MTPWTGGASPRRWRTAYVSCTSSSGEDARPPPGALRPYFPRHQRFSSASQWLSHVPLALLEAGGWSLLAVC